MSICMPKAALPADLFCARHSTQVGQVAEMEAVLLWQNHPGCNSNMQDLGKVWGSQCIRYEDSGLNMAALGFLTEARSLPLLCSVCTRRVYMKLFLP